MRRFSWALLAAAAAVLLGCSACCVSCFGGEPGRPAGNEGTEARPGAGEQRPAQLRCPVTGAKIAELDNPIAVEFDGFRFWVATNDAVLKAKEKPADAFKALAKNGDAAEPISQACPVMGHAIDKKLFVYRDGKRIYMCCMGCRKKIENNWDAMLKKLAQQAKDGDPKDLKPM